MYVLYIVKIVFSSKSLTVLEVTVPGEHHTSALSIRGPKVVLHV